MAPTISAGRALTAARIDTDEVRRKLPHVEPYAVPIRLARPWFRATWAKGIAAVTMPWAIYVTDTVFARLADETEAWRHGTLIVHELVHLEQYRRLGSARHITQYLGDYLGGRRRGRSHWDAYRQVRLEVEAREIAARFAGGASAR